MPLETFPINISKGWMPDYASFAMPDGALSICTNLLPYDEYYAPALSAIPYSANAVSGTPLTGIEIYSGADDTYYSFVGTSSKLYRLETDYSLTDATRAEGNYTTSGNRWYFAPWGENLVATNYNDVPQIMAPNFTTAKFRALGGNPPRAKYCISYYGRIIFAFVQDKDGTVHPKRIHWSDRENIEQYTYTSGGSDYQTIADAVSPITGICNLGDMFLVSHRHSLTIGYLSTNSLYSIELHRGRFTNRGALEGSLISVDNVAYFFDERDIYMCDGEQIVPIGDGIKRTFLNYLDIENYYRTTATYDPRNGYIMWCVMSTSSSTPDKILIYNPKNKRFTLLSTTQHCIWNLHRAALNMDNMDLLYPNTDEIPVSLDGNFFYDTSPFVACVTSDGKISTFQGYSLQWNIRTREESNKDGILYVNNIRPKANKYTGSINTSVGSPIPMRVKLGYRFNENEEVQFTDNSFVNSKGYANFRQTGRFLSVDIIGGFHEGLVGLEAIGKLIARR